MTAFQVEAKEELTTTLAKAGLVCDSHLVKGKRENYIKAHIPGTAFDMFIYEDEAGIQGSSIDYRFEKYDFKNSKQLITAFVTRVSELANAAPNQAL